MPQAAAAAVLRELRQGGANHRLRAPTVLKQMEMDLAQNGQGRRVHARPTTLFRECQTFQQRR